MGVSNKYTRRLNKCSARAAKAYSTMLYSMLLQFMSTILYLFPFLCCTKSQLSTA